MNNNLWYITKTDKLIFTTITITFIRLYQSFTLFWRDFGPVITSAHRGSHTFIYAQLFYEPSTAQAEVWSGLWLDHWNTCWCSRDHCCVSFQPSFSCGTDGLTCAHILPQPPGLFRSNFTKLSSALTFF